MSKCLLIENHVMMYYLVVDAFVLQVVWRVPPVKPLPVRLVLELPVELGAVVALGDEESHSLQAVLFLQRTKLSSNNF